MEEYHHYGEHLKHLAKELRNHSTKAEVRLWTELLKAKQLMGYAFLRQRPVGNYIADFMCKKLGLIIEVDGITHAGREKEDKNRDAVLLELGFTVLRFTDEDVMENLDFVKETIINWIKNKGQ